MAIWGGRSAGFHEAGRNNRGRAGPLLVGIVTGPAGMDHVCRGAHLVLDQGRTIRVRRNGRGRQKKHRVVRGAAPVRLQFHAARRSGSISCRDPPRLIVLPTSDGGLLRQLLSIKLSANIHPNNNRGVDRSRLDGADQEFLTPRSTWISHRDGRRRGHWAGGLAASQSAGMGSSCAAPQPQSGATLGKALLSFKAAPLFQTKANT